MLSAIPSTKINSFPICVSEMARATALETADRIDTLQGLILEGEPNTSCLAFARKECGISRARGYELLKRAWTQIKADVDETGIDR